MRRFQRRSGINGTRWFRKGNSSLSTLGIYSQALSLRTSAQLSVVVVTMLLRRRDIVYATIRLTLTGQQDAYKPTVALVSCLGCVGDVITLCSPDPRLLWITKLNWITKSHHKRLTRSKRQGPLRSAVLFGREASAVRDACMKSACWGRYAYGTRPAHLNVHHDLPWHSQHPKSVRDALNACWLADESEGALFLSRWLAAR